MVDLVKIRKKAREKAAARASAAKDAAATAPEPHVTPLSSPAPKKQKQKQKGPASPEVHPESESSGVSAAPAAVPAPEEAPAIHQPATAPAADQPLTSKLKRFLDSAGERRVERAQETEAATEAQLELLTFLIAGELYAVSIEKVVEIVTPRAMTRIPNADPLVVGILSLRGLIVTLLDARRRLGHPGNEEASAETRIIVVQLDHETLGFSVDKVLRVVKVEAAAVEPHPVVHASEHDESVAGVFRHADALTILLDLDKLLNTRAVVAPAS